MTVDQALFEMELVGHDFYLFSDVDTGRPSVVYRRHAYDYGLIRLSRLQGQCARRVDECEAHLVAERAVGVAQPRRADAVGREAGGHGGALRGDVVDLRAQLEPANPAALERPAGSAAAARAWCSRGRERRDAWRSRCRRSAGGPAGEPDRAREPARGLVDDRDRGPARPASPAGASGPAAPRPPQAGVPVNPVATVTGSRSCSRNRRDVARQHRAHGQHRVVQPAGR